MPKVLAVAIAMLSALPFAGLHVAIRARADDATFTLPPFQTGDYAAYEDSQDGFLNLSVGALTSVMDKSMRLKDAIPVAYDSWGATEYFSPTTMSLEAHHLECAVARNPNGTCMRPLENWQWYRQGSPAVMGATYLQGRSFSIGDSWNLTGECSECTWRRVTIESPNERSPMGTDFVAHIRGDYIDTAFKGRIHMSGNQAFPLLVEWAVWGTTTRLLNMTPGSIPILPPTPPEDPSYSARLPALPFQNGRPVEGTPLPGWPSWSDARNATGPEEATTTSGAQLIHVHYHSPTYNQLDLKYPVEYERFSRVDFHDVEARFAIPDESDSLTTYYADTASVAGFQSPIIYTSATHTTAAASTVVSCPQLSVPLWDTVRAVMGFGYLHDFNGMRLRAPTTATCAASLEIVGQFYSPPEGGWGVAEHLSISAHRGYLRSATSIVQS